jgi:hypothetical protein
MTFELIRDVLAWSTLINMIVLFLWVIFISIAHDFTYRIHCGIFKISIEQFDAIHYGGIIAFKLGWVLYNLAPYLAMRIVGS